MTCPKFMPSSTAELPVDPMLPGLGTAFDTGRIAEIVGGGQVAPGVPVDCRVSYVRYKPGTSCVVAYEFESAAETVPVVGHVKVYSAGDFAVARDKLGGRRWWTGQTWPPFVVLEADCAILFLFPNDAEMSGLRLFADPKKLQRVLYANSGAYPQEQWRISDRRIQIRLIRYKPEKRAVVRIDTRVVGRESGERRDFTAFGRVYAGGGACERFAFMRALECAAAGRVVRVPQALGCLEEEGVVLIDRLAGDPVSCDDLVSGRDRDLATHAGAALRELHRCEPCPLVARRRQDAIEDCAATARSIAVVAPEVAGDAAGAVERLREMSARTRQGERGFVHGDFHPGQLLVSGEGIGVLDFDRAHEAERMVDIGNFRAHLLASDAGTAASREAGALAALEGYRAGGEGGDLGGLDFWTAVGLMNLAVRPFRSLEHGWRSRIATLVATCEAVMNG